MAIASFAAPVAGLRGKIGGLIWSANGSGPYVKIWGRGANPRTQPQSIERSYLGRMPTLWRDLSSGQKTDWETFATNGAQALTNSLGETYYASGWNWFCKCNIRLLRVGRATRNDKPTQARPAAPTIDDFVITQPGTETNYFLGQVPSNIDEEDGYPLTNLTTGITTTFDYWKSFSGTLGGNLWCHASQWGNYKHVRMYPCADDYSYNPKTFNIILNDGVWRTLKTITNESWATPDPVDFFFPNPWGSWGHHRLQLLANQGSISNIGFNELEIYKGEAGCSRVVYPEDEFANSPAYDLVLHIAQAPSIGNQVQYPGYYEIVTSQTPGRSHVEFQAKIEEIFGVISVNRSWFARLYRQTTEGIRSAAATARTETI